MAILNKTNIWILLEHNCCNYGNSEKKIQLTPDDTIVATVAIVEKYMDPFSSQLSQL